MEVTRCKETHVQQGVLAAAAATTDDAIIITDWHMPALSLLCHCPPWAFFKFILGERARSEGKQILIFRVGLQGGTSKVEGGLCPACLGSDKSSGGAHGVL